MTAATDRLTDAMIGLLVSDGFEGVTVRRVAAEAGVSIGAVQHHFPTKEAMLAAAMARVSEEFRARLERQVSSDDDPERLLRVLGYELLGIGEERHAASVIWLQRLARAAVDPAVATAHARDWLEIEQLLAVAVAGCRPGWAERRRRDAAAALLALLDGLASAVLTEPDRMPPTRAERLLDDHLARLLAHEADDR